MIAGSGSETEKLQAKMKSLGLQSWFHFAGFDRDIPSFLKQLDIFVLPSRTEGFPLSLLEALAAGLPCIAARVGGVPEMLGENGGILVEPNSPEALARAFMEMMRADVRKMYASRTADISKKYSLRNCMEQYARIYSSLIPGHLQGGL